MKTSKASALAKTSVKWDRGHIWAPWRHGANLCSTGHLMISNLLGEINKFWEGFPHVPWSFLVSGSQLNENLSYMDKKKIWTDLAHGDLTTNESLMQDKEIDGHVFYYVVCLNRHNQLFLACFSFPKETPKPFVPFRPKSTANWTERRTTRSGCSLEK